MEKVAISDAAIAEEVRKQMNVATVEEKGLMSSTDKRGLNQILSYGLNYNSIKIGTFSSWERSSLLIHGIYVQTPFSFFLSVYNLDNSTTQAPKIFITNITPKIPFKVYWKRENGYLDIYLVSTVNSTSADSESINILGNKTVERKMLVVDDSYAEVVI